MNDLRLRIYGVTGGLEVLFEGGHSRCAPAWGTPCPALNGMRWIAGAAPTIYERLGRRGDPWGKCGHPDFARGAALQRCCDRPRNN